MKVIIASKNPVKINAVKQGFKKVFPKKTFEFVGEEVSSGVSVQPMTDTETLKGAINRVKNIKHIDADFWVGIEGGVEEKDGKMEAFAWVVIASNTGKTGKARSATFFLPQEHTRLIKSGIELGHADDKVFGLINSKQKMGTVGMLTKRAVNRTEYYTMPVVLALIPFLNKKLY